MKLQHTKKGDTVFIVSINHGNRKPESKACLVVQAGPKWVSVNIYGNKIDRFERESGEHDGGNYSPQYRAYLNEQAYANEQEAKELRMTLSRSIASQPLSILRQINQLVNQEA
ncbi:hypothetical protein [Spirosoma sp.]|uniref:beta barrel domain-containing protein n=1 Tax=Spirosoma sp. TaxID=1899569 RepID=UPI002617DCD6|nr:hypothetical protein [Spirosoma sp.]MCX6217670.1 hypothetical protein [Spirosoma sp.]